MMNKFERPQPPHEEDEESDRHPLVGGEVISPTASVPEDRRPDGSVDMEPAWHRGWLEAMTRAYRNQDVEKTERERNVREIVEAAVDAGVPKAMIKPHLEGLGITVVSKK